MKLYSFLILLSLIFIPFTVSGKQHEFNKLPESPFNKISVDDVVNKAYLLGSWDGEEGEVRKYQEGSTELYLITPNKVYRNAFLVIPKDRFDKFLEMLHNSARQMDNMKNDLDGDYSNNFDPTSYPTDYEFINKDSKSGDTYIYGAQLKDMVTWRRVDKTPGLLMCFRVPKAPQFPFYKDGKEVLFFFKEKNLEELLNVMDKANGNSESVVNPESFQRIGTFSYTNSLGIGLIKQREVLKYGSGINTKYYIELSEEYVDLKLYQNYLWIKGIKYNLFKKWINDIYTAYNRLFLSKPKSESFEVLEEIPLPPGLTFGGIIKGKFDVNMTVLEGYALTDEKVSADIHYDNYSDNNSAMITFGKVSIIFEKPSELKEFIDALGK